MRRLLRVFFVCFVQCWHAEFPIYVYVITFSNYILVFVLACDAAQDMHFNYKIFFLIKKVKNFFAKTLITCCSICSVLSLA